jgi:hypothetical protein
MTKPVDGQDFRGSECRSVVDPKVTKNILNSQCLSYNQLSASSLSDTSADKSFVTRCIEMVKGWFLALWQSLTSCCGGQTAVPPPPSIPTITPTNVSVSSPVSPSPAETPPQIQGGADTPVVNGKSALDFWDSFKQQATQSIHEMTAACVKFYESKSGARLDPNIVYFGSLSYSLRFSVGGNPQFKNKEIVLPIGKDVCIPELFDPLNGPEGLADSVRGEVWVTLIEKDPHSPQFVLYTIYQTWDSQGPCFKGSMQQQYSKQSQISLVNNSLSHYLSPEDIQEWIQAMETTPGPMRAPVQPIQ